MTALQVLRFEAALWEIAEEAAFAGEPRSGRTDPPPGAEAAFLHEKPTCASGPRAGCDLQRWLDLSA